MIFLEYIIVVYVILTPGCLVDVTFHLSTMNCRFFNGCIIQTGNIAVCINLPIQFLFGNQRFFRWHLRAHFQRFQFVRRFLLKYITAAHYECILHILFNHCSFCGVTLPDIHMHQLMEKANYENLHNMIFLNVSYK